MRERRRGPGLQRLYAPRSICFGCGPANAKGLRLESRVEGDDLVATWKPARHHEAFEGMLNGGIIGTILDCHCNWAAAHALMKRMGAAGPPCTVTAEYTIRLLHPTPSGAKVYLKARPVEILADRAWVEGSLSAGGRVCATCRGLFVAVKPGHPAYHRW